MELLQFGIGGSAPRLMNATFAKFGFESADESSDWNAIKPTVIANIESNQPVLIAHFRVSRRACRGARWIQQQQRYLSHGPGLGAGYDNDNGNDDWYSLPTIDAGGNSFTGIDTVIYNIEPILPSPTGVTASQGTYSDHVHLTWNAAPEATGYKVWRSTINDPTTASLITSATPDRNELR